ncbi:MAG: hypothetical protein AMJ65_03255 [Phycisphaerae bacterium SG8_4]|nr:MAG: hypothetical protein AMJ65_03255 [Phycisphaerae bacterium SG8_4]
MRRRTFIKTTGVLGVNAALPWADLYARARKSSEFLKEKSSDRMLFPRPCDGAELPISPVGLAWLPCPAAADYRVEIFAQNGPRVYGQNVGKDPVHLPGRILPSGDYAWDVIALDEKGTDIARRGRQSFKILPGAAKLPWVDPNELLSRVPAEHSRILYPRADLDRIRATLSTSRAKSWRACKSAAERALSKGIPDFPKYHLIEDEGTRRLEYGRYFSYFRGYVDGALMNLSLAFLMSEQDKYARAAREILLEIASWPTADDDVTSVSARWGDEAGLSFSKCAHIAYDWLYPALSDAEKRQVFDMCRARAWQTYRRLNRGDYLTYPGESHAGRLIAYLTDMSLAMAGETPDAETWLTYSLKAMLTFYPHWAGADGGWAEGTPYGLWYNTFYIPAFESLRQLADYDLWQRPFFNNVRYFFFYCLANHGEIRPFGDSAEGGGPGVRGGSGYAELMSFHAQRFNDPYVGWWVEQIPGYDGRKSGFAALMHEDELPARAPGDLPNSRAFKGVGWAGLHSDLTSPKSDTCMIFKSSPYGSVSHSHADQNAFAIMKGGTALAIPSGYYGPSYGKPHHAQWTRSTKANNCILVNGQGQKIRSAKANGAIVDFKDAPGYSYVTGDATPSYAGRLNKCIRRILFLRPGLFLLLDEIEAPEASQYQWLLHAFEQMEIRDNQVTSRRRDATLNVALACPLGLNLTQTDQFDTPYNYGIPKAYHRDRANHWHVTAETVLRSKKTRIAAVMAVYDADDQFQVQPKHVNGWFGAIARGDFGQVEGWIRTDENGGTRPSSFTKDDIDRPIDLWGRGRDGEIFFV